MNKIFDLHNDFFTTLKTYKQKVKYVEKCKNQNLNNITTVVWTSKLDKNKVFQTIDDANCFSIQHGLKLAIEDLHFINPSNIDELCKYNPVYTGLTWNNENKLAGGSNSFVGMTKTGVQVVQMLEERNIQIDTAHLNEASFLTFSNITQKPILCSHTASRSLTEHPRNLKDYQIKIIEESGGLLGICFVKDFLTQEKTANVGDIVRHIDYIVSKWGIDIVALGTDFHGTTNLPKGIKNYKSLQKLQERLKALGYSDEAIDKIFFKNAYNFFENNHKN